MRHTPANHPAKSTLSMAKDTLGWVQTGIFGAQAIIFIIQTAYFRYQAKMLRRTVDASVEQSRDMKDSIAQATRAANAMETSAKAATIASENVVVGTERATQQMRAYLSVRISGGRYQGEAPNAPFAVSPIVINTGQTPAYKVGYVAKADVVRFPLPDDFSFQPLEQPRRVLGVLAPQQHMIISAAIQSGNYTDAEGIKRGRDSRTYIWGTVFYEDVVGDKRHTNFAHSIFWKPGPQGDVISGDYADRHNDAT